MTDSIRERKLEDALRKIEWAFQGRCPCCNQSKRMGHIIECEVALALAASVAEPPKLLCPICHQELSSGISWCGTCEVAHAVPSVECHPCGYIKQKDCARAVAEKAPAPRSDANAIQTARLETWKAALKIASGWGSKGTACYRIPELIQDEIDKLVAEKAPVASAEHNRYWKKYGDNPAEKAPAPPEPLFHKTVPIQEPEQRIMDLIHEAYIEYGALMYQEGRKNVTEEFSAEKAAPAAPPVVDNLKMHQEAAKRRARLVEESESDKALAGVAQEVAQPKENSREESIEHREVDSDNSDSASLDSFLVGNSADCRAGGKLAAATPLNADELEQVAKEIVSELSESCDGIDPADADTCEDMEEIIERHVRKYLAGFSLAAPQVREETKK